MTSSTTLHQLTGRGKRIENTYYRHGENNIHGRVPSEIFIKTFCVQERNDSCKDFLKIVLNNIVWLLGTEIGFPIGFLDMFEVKIMHTIEIMEDDVEFVGFCILYIKL